MANLAASGSRRRGGTIIRHAITIVVAIMGGISVRADTYVDPGKLEWLAPPMVKRLQDMHCKIPIRVDDIPATPMATGEFAASGQLDVAVICVRQGGSKIVLGWGGPIQCSDTVEGYGQSISPVDEYFIVSRYEYYGGRKPPAITHQGINDAILEKASTVRYCENGTWLELTGSD